MTIHSFAGINHLSATMLVAASVSLVACGGGNSPAAPQAASTPQAAPTYSIGGTLAGLGAVAAPVGGHKIVLNNNGIDTLTLTANGAFTFANKIATGGKYKAGISSATQNCAITAGASGVIATSNVSNVNVSCGMDSYTAGGAMVTARYDGTFTMLNNGKVLATGGASANSTLAELYDPATNTWTATGAMGTTRAVHTATLLPNGKVLVTGGRVGNGAGVSTATTEIYDPATGLWTAAAPMAAARGNHTATLLNNGKVLVTAGYDAGALITLTSAELYDPATNTWAAAQPLLLAASSHNATLLSNGKVLVTGGNSTKVAQLYDPVAGSWSQTPTFIPFAPGYFHTSTVLADNNVLVCGGTPTLAFENSGCATYNPTANSWTAVGSLLFAVRNHTAVLLPNGKVLISGGYNMNSPVGGAQTNWSELYDPVTQAWAPTITLTTARSSHMAMLLNNGKVLISGGSFGILGPLNSSELYW